MTIPTLLCGAVKGYSIIIRLASMIQHNSCERRETSNKYFLRNDPRYIFTSGFYDV